MEIVSQWIVFFGGKPCVLYAGLQGGVFNYYIGHSSGEKKFNIEKISDQYANDLISGVPVKINVYRGLTHDSGKSLPTGFFDKTTSALPRCEKHNFVGYNCAECHNEKYVQIERDKLIATLAVLKNMLRMGGLDQGVTIANDMIEYYTYKPTIPEDTP